MISHAISISLDEAMKARTRKIFFHAGRRRFQRILEAIQLEIGGKNSGQDESVLSCVLTLTVCAVEGKVPISKI